MGVFYFVNGEEKLPDYFKQTIIKTAPNESVSYLKELKDDYGVVVYYPVLNLNNSESEKVLNKAFVDGAENILKQLVVEAKNKVGKVKNIRAEYEISRVVENAYSLKYTCFISDNEVETTSLKTFIVDLKNNQVADLDKFFDEVALKRIRQSLRIAIKKNSTTSAIAYRKDVLELTKKLCKNFVFTKDGVLFYVSGLTNDYFNFTVPYQELQNHCLVDFKTEANNPYYEIAKHYVDPHKPMVALTFDDGPHREFTSQIVKQLEEYNSSATFFVLGERMKRNASTLKIIIESGSEIGSHSMDHDSLVYSKKLAWQFNQPTRIMDEISNNSYKIRTYRPPYGAVNKRVRDNSPYPLILWSTDTLDWKYRNVNRNVKAALKKVKDGSIILMHDIYEESKDAALIIIPQLIEKGYQLVTVSELMEARGIKHKPGLVVFEGFK